MDRFRLLVLRARRAASTAARVLVVVPLVPLASQAATVVPNEIQQPGTQPGEVGQLETPDKCDNCHGNRSKGIELAHEWRGSMMSWNKALSGSPVWMRYGVYATFAYSIVSIVFLSQDARDHVALPGTTNVATLRMFSASWMLFYGAASAIFYSAFRKPSLITQRKCPQGHLVAESDQFCATCGTSLASRAST